MVVRFVKWNKERKIDIEGRLVLEASRMYNRKEWNLEEVWVVKEEKHRTRIDKKK